MTATKISTLRRLSLGSLLLVASVQGWNLASQQLSHTSPQKRTIVPRSMIASSRRSLLLPSEQQQQYQYQTLVCRMAKQDDSDEQPHDEAHHASSGSSSSSSSSSSNTQRQQHRHHETAPPTASAASAASSASSFPSEQQQQQYEKAAEKKFRLAKAQADIDRILNNPLDPPFDIDSELKKVVGISPPPSGATPEEYALEEQFGQWEEELYQAVKQQDYEKAAKHQHEISQLHVDDCGLVLQVNSRFYQAFSKKDWDAMKTVWLPDRSCVCIHPSQKPLLGIKDILTSWQRMFQIGSGGFQKTWMEPQQIRLTVKGTMAIVTCEEHVYARRFVRGQKRQTELVNKLQASNVFRKVGSQWYMTYHHSSWHADSEAAKMALKGGSSSSSSNSNNGNNNNNNGAVKKIVVRGRPSNTDPEDAEGLESILGINNLGPILGDENNNNNNNGNDETPQRRIIMGSLSDIFNGDLGELLGNNDNNMKGGDPNNINNNNNMGMNHNLKDLFGDSNNNGENNNNGAIIQFRRVEDVDDDDDDDDEDEEEEEIDAEESVAMLKQWAKKSEAQKQHLPPQHHHNTQQQQQQPKKKHDSIRQNCIGALRKLTNDGRISPKQKRVLLTDIISCSAKGEYSMVEVAYELLCAETTMGTNNNKIELTEEEGDAEEEFADQCRVFAQTLMD